MTAIINSLITLSDLAFMKPAQVEAIVQAINSYDPSTEKWRETDRNGRQETFRHYIGTRINSDMTAEQILKNMGYWKESKSSSAHRKVWERVETNIIEAFFLKHIEETEAAVHKLDADRSRRHGKAHYRLVIIDGEVRERSEWVEKLPEIPRYVRFNTSKGVIYWDYTFDDDALPSAFDEFTGKSSCHHSPNQYEWYEMILRTMKGERIF